MEHNYTLNSLVRYLYKESSLLRSLEIENQINEDQNLRSYYLRLKKAFKSMPKVSFYPSDKTMDAILDYSKKTGLSVNA